MKTARRAVHDRLAPLVDMEIEIPSIDMEIGESREWLLEIVYDPPENAVRF